MIESKTIDSNAINLPPQNIEAEQFVLGAVFLDNDALLKANEIIKVDDFYRDSHKRIYRAMLSLSTRGEPIDIITLTEELRKNNDLDDVGGLAYLTHLAAIIPTSANVRHHAKIVRERAILRSIIQTAHLISEKAYNATSDADEILDYAEHMIFEIGDKRTNNSFANLKDIVKDTLKTIETLINKRSNVTGIPTGFKDLDDITAGFQPGDLIIIGGRPSMGKTAFALNIAQHCAIHTRLPSAVFSLEMSKEQLAMRMLCSEASVDYSKLRKGFLNQKELKSIIRAASTISESPIFIDDTPAISVMEIRAKARRLKTEQKGLGLIVIDYLQLMRGRTDAERREQEISEISRSLKALAKELHVPVVALSQLNRRVEYTQEKRPNLGDLRESGAIEQDADVIIFLYRDEVYNKKTQDKGVAEIIIAKQRNGPTKTIKLTFLHEFTKFVDLTTEQYEGEEEFY
ncbi:MAG: replicative DNA helicase [Thermodesulfovibrionales bacterium]|nr:replicative DNA helicase [Thermodesulfovibrionales bacterium]